MPFSVPFWIEDLHYFKPFKSHVTKVSQMSKHADIKLLAKFHSYEIDLLLHYRDVSDGGICRYPILCRVLIGDIYQNFLVCAVKSVR